MLVPQTGQISAVGLTSDSLSRGLRLLDALLTGAEGQGHSVVFTQKESTHLRFLVDGEEIQFRLSEAYDQKAHTPTKEEVARKKDWNWFQPKKWDYVPSGRLRLSVEDLPYGVKSAWCMVSSVGLGSVPHRLGRARHFHQQRSLGTWLEESRSVCTRLTRRSSLGARGPH
jgi:hypothetical protein